MGSVLFSLGGRSFKVCARTGESDPQRLKRIDFATVTARLKSGLPRKSGVATQTLQLRQFRSLSNRASAFPLSYFFAGAAAAIVYSPAQMYSNPPSAVPVVLQVPDPLIPFIFPVPPVI